MNIYIAGLVIFLTSLLVLCLAGAATSRPAVPLERLADPAPLPGKLARAGYLEVEYLPGPPFAADHGYYGPFPVDTGPLLILSDQAAANVALEREIRVMIAEAERKIGPVE